MEEETSQVVAPNVELKRINTDSISGPNPNRKPQIQGFGGDSIGQRGL